MASELDSRLAGKTSAAALAAYSLQTHTDVGPFTRNTSFWAADLVPQLTCASPSNSAASNRLSVTLITRRHMICTRHGGIGVGYPSDGITVRFVTSSNTMVTRVISQHFDTQYDFVVFLLDSDLPSSIAHAKIVPDGFRNYLSHSPRIPVFMFDQEEKGLVADIRETLITRMDWIPPSNSVRAQFYELPVPGDSGDPVFCIINGEPVLIGLITSEFHGPFFDGLNGAVNSAIASVDALGGVSTGYTASNPALTGFSKVR